jgi:2-oxoisovalerate dehydrogenase E1 component alpha subunit
MVVTNNNWGISTAACTQHGERHIVDRGKPFGIPGDVVDGNDPIASWHAVQRGMNYCRKRRQPYMIEAMVSRLYGHSSSSGALRVKNEPDCIELFEGRLLASGLVKHHELETVHRNAQAEVEAALEQTLREPDPQPSDVETFTYARSDADAVYPSDYTGLPG